MFIVRGLSTDGGEVFYTGRAGNGWVSNDRNEAFVYTSQDEARRKALNFNRMEPLHGFRFIAIGVGSAPNADGFYAEVTA